MKENLEQHPKYTWSAQYGWWWLWLLLLLLLLPTSYLFDSCLSHHIVKPSFLFFWGRKPHGNKKGPRSAVQPGRPSHTPFFITDKVPGRKVIPGTKFCVAGSTRTRRNLSDTPNIYHNTSLPVPPRWTLPPWHWESLIPSSNNNNKIKIKWLY